MRRVSDNHVPLHQLAAINLYGRDLLPPDDILDYVGFSDSTFCRVWKLWWETGRVKKDTFGIRRLLHHDDVQ